MLQMFYSCQHHIPTISPSQVQFSQWFSPAMMPQGLFTGLNTHTHKLLLHIILYNNQPPFIYFHFKFWFLWIPSYHFYKNWSLQPFFLWTHKGKHAVFPLMVWKAMGRRRYKMARRRLFVCQYCAVTYMWKGGVWQVVTVAMMTMLQWADAELL